MRTLRSIALTLLLVTAPAPALAEVCFSGGQGTFILDVAAQTSRFFSLVGEFIDFQNASFPLSGTAHVRNDGKAHFGVVFHGASLTPPQVGAIIQGTLDPPNYNSGSGYFQNLNGNDAISPLTFAPANCPASFPLTGGPGE